MLGLLEGKRERGRGPLQRRLIRRRRPRWGETIASHAHSALKYVRTTTGATPSQPTTDRGRQSGDVTAESTPIMARVSTYRPRIRISSPPSTEKGVQRRRVSARRC